MGRHDRPSRTTFGSDERGNQGGSVGIVLLIGSLLVATLIAAFTFKLDRDLSDNSRTASDETLQDLGAGLEVVAMIGERGPDGDVVRMDLTIRPSRGALTPLSTLALQLSDGERRRSLLPGEPGNGTYGITIVRDSDGSTQNATLPVLGRGDLARIAIDLAAMDLGLSAGDSLAVRLLPDGGIETQVVARVPVTAPTDRFISLD